MKFSKLLFIAFVLQIFMLSKSWALNPVSTGTGKITYIENGWSGEGFAIHMENSSAISGCSAPSTEFGIDANHTAYKILVAMMMMAYSQQIPISLVVDQGTCVLGARTKVLSIRMQ